MQSKNSAPQQLTWDEDGESRSARWRSESGNPPAKRVVIGHDQMTADHAYRLACEGTAILWRGDFQNARQLLQAMARRIDSKPRKAKKHATEPSPIDAFNLHRLAQSQRARTLAMLMLPLDGQYTIPLRRAPDVRHACEEAYGPPTDEPSVVSLREVLGLVGAHEWRKKGVEIGAVGGRIHPYYGVFSPVRGEYIDLVANQPLPSKELAFDIGTGTGVLSAVLARRGVGRIVATDVDARALACARENIGRLGLDRQVEIVEADMFPEGRAPLIVCNPPWLPARPSSPIEHAVYDPDSRMLLGFLKGLPDHLTPQGEGWLILSDFAEHLGLRAPGMLAEAIAQAGLEVVARHDIKPRHGKAVDRDDPLHAARSKETTSLYRLRARA